MARIEYENQNGKRDSRGNRHWNIDVRLDGKIVGEIISLAGGYAYKPKGRKPGETFATLAECKRSVEGE
jgi:hypothetical protein